jgi:hypothetical protein
MDASGSLQLLDWKRRVAGVYREIREADDPEAAWERWRAVREELFQSHAQSPIAERDRGSFAGLDYFPYDPAFRLLADVEDVGRERISIGTSGGGSYEFTRFGRATFELGGGRHGLDLYWLEGYGGGLFLPIRDATSGTETYGAGRYLLDTVKGADLGTENGSLVLDFNFAYNPSCAYDPRWVCPLAPPGNRVAIQIRAGERWPSG